MCVFRPRRNCSLSTLAAKKRTWMRSMITAIAKTRQIAIGYMPGPPPFQWCATVSPGMPLPTPVEAGGPGVPEKGALPAAAPVPGLEAGTGGPGPQIRDLAWVVAADVGEPAGEADRCRALDGTPAPVRCPSSL